MRTEDGGSAAEHPVWAAMLDLYAGAVTGDRARIDAHLRPDTTFFDSHHLPLVRGLAELDAVRDARPPAEHVGGAAPTLDATDPVLRELAPGVVLLVHRFTWTGDDGVFSVRNTSVWMRGDDGVWRMVHNHEDVTA